MREIQQCVFAVSYQQSAKNTAFMGSVECFWMVKTRFPWCSLTKETIFKQTLQRCSTEFLNYDPQTPPTPFILFYKDHGPGSRVYIGSCVSCFSGTVTKVRSLLTNCATAFPSQVDEKAAWAEPRWAELKESELPNRKWFSERSAEWAFNCKGRALCVRLVHVVETFLSKWSIWNSYMHHRLDSWCVPLKHGISIAVKKKELHYSPLRLTKQCLNLWSI